MVDPHQRKVYIHCGTGCVIDIHRFGYIFYNILRYLDGAVLNFRKFYLVCWIDFWVSMVKVRKTGVGDL